VTLRAFERGNAIVGSHIKHQIGVALRLRAFDAGVLPKAGDLDATSDEGLMLRVSRGDEAAFRCLAGRHSPKMFALARRMANSDADAEEIVQEAMIRVWTTAHRWQPKAALRTWLYRVVVNLCLNWRRQKVFASLDQARDPPDPTPSAIERLERQQSNCVVASAVAGLPERQRAVIVLTYYEGLCNAETAAVLHTTVSSVEALLVRAKRTLRAELGKTLDAAR
jgi:RNA polymerase sigma-70 factor (ECF subfamily)